jgi:hypothetical protein
MHMKWTNKYLILSFKSFGAIARSLIQNELILVVIC